jgi:hypothetical protein
MVLMMSPVANSPVVAMTSEIIMITRHIILLISHKCRTNPNSSFKKYYKQNGKLESSGLNQVFQELTIHGRGQGLTNEGDAPQHY